MLADATRPRFGSAAGGGGYGRGYGGLGGRETHKTGLFGGCSVEPLVLMRTRYFSDISLTVCVSVIITPGYKVDGRMARC